MKTLYNKIGESWRQHLILYPDSRRALEFRSLVERDIGKFIQKVKKDIEKSGCLKVGHHVNCIIDKRFGKQFTQNSGGKNNV